MMHTIVHIINILFLWLYKSVPWGSIVKAYIKNTVILLYLHATPNGCWCPGTFTCDGYVACGLSAAPDASVPEENGVGNPSSAVAVRMPRPASPAAGGSFMDGRFHIPHALWVKKSLHHLCSLTGTELSEVHEGLSLHPGPDLVCSGLLGTLFIRLCLLRALDYQPTQEHMLINTFFFFFEIFFFPMNVGSAEFILWFFFVFTYIHSLICKHDGQWLFSAVLFKVNSKLLVWTIYFWKECWSSCRSLLKILREVSGGRKEELINLYRLDSNCPLEAEGLLSLEAWQCQERRRGVGLWLPFRGSPHNSIDMVSWKSGTMAQELWLSKCLQNIGVILKRLPFLEMRWLGYS